MDVTTSSVPGMGVLHDGRTRDGHHVRLIVERDGQRHFVVYDDGATDEPLTTITLDNDEADHIADLLHSRSVPDRLAELERRLGEIAHGSP